MYLTCVRTMLLRREDVGESSAGNGVFKPKQPVPSQPKLKPIEPMLTALEQSQGSRGESKKDEKVQPFSSKIIIVSSRPSQELDEPRAALEQPYGSRSEGRRDEKIQAERRHIQRDVFNKVKMSSAS